MMKSDAFLINNARGEIIDENALLQALKQGWIKGAGLDFLDSCANPQWRTLDNLVVTPHIAGYPADYPDENYYRVVDVIIDISKMQMPPWIVNKNVKPKWSLK